MNDERLKIISTQSKTPEQTIFDSRNGWRKEAQEHFEQMWLNDPHQFNPLRNCMERERLARTWKLANKFIPLQDKLVGDLACGGGVLSKQLKEAGAKVHALDIASQALQILREYVPNIDETFQQCLPHTTWEDNVYDLLFADEVIAYLPAQQLRLFMSELCRLVKPNGYVICSTSLDLDSQDPLERFASLAETEFKIHEWSCSYHRLHIRLRNFFGAPKFYTHASNNEEYRQQELQKRKGFSRKWLNWNSQRPLVFFWKGLQFLFNPIDHLLKQNRTILLFLEKICRFFWGENGISHAIFIASRRPLQPLVLPDNEIPVEKMGKRHTWE